MKTLLLLFVCSLTISLNAQTMLGKTSMDVIMSFGMPHNMKDLNNTSSFYWYSGSGRDSMTYFENNKCSSEIKFLNNSHRQEIKNWVKGLDVIQPMTQITDTTFGGCWASEKYYVYLEGNKYSFKLIYLLK